jgi:hypothetical protein
MNTNKNQHHHRDHHHHHHRDHHRDHHLHPHNNRPHYPNHLNHPYQPQNFEDGQHEEFRNRYYNNINLEENNKENRLPKIISIKKILKSDN